MRGVSSSWSMNEEKGHWRSRNGLLKKTIYRKPWFLPQNDWDCHMGISLKGGTPSSHPISKVDFPRPRPALQLDLQPRHVATPHAVMVSPKNVRALNHCPKMVIIWYHPIYLPFKQDLHSWGMALWYPNMAGRKKNNNNCLKGKWMAVQSWELNGSWSKQRCEMTGRYHPSQTDQPME